MAKGTTWEKLRAVFYKNYLYRRERWLILLIEFFLPILGICLFLALKKKFDFSVIQWLVLFMMAISLFLGIIANVGGSVSEKETGFKELLKIMGMDGWIQWIGWITNSLMVSLASMFIFSLIVGFAVWNKECDPSLTIVICLLFTIHATTFAYFLSSFFSRHTVAMAIIGILWFVLMALPEIIQSAGEKWPIAARVPFLLIPHVGLGRFGRILTDMPKDYDYDWSRDNSLPYTVPNPLKWSNMFDTLVIGYGDYKTKDELTAGIIFVMMIVSSIVFVILSMYIENVMPSKFGVRKPIWYPFLLRTWYTPKGNKIKHNQSQKESNGIENENPKFESEPSGLNTGVAIKNLKKSFEGNKLVVDGVTLNMYEGQITALLGHNGAGKTTTLSILTGITAPSGGTVIINGHDINNGLDEARQDLGFCPQENMLFDRLSVTHHLQFVGRLKGLSNAEALSAAEELMDQFDLTEKKKTQVRQLSGGQKRKLQLAMALIGQAKIIICDEPTSGMDPETRRSIWNVLLNMRTKRTIILTTHYMEEADVLADRIAIMSLGKVMCCGSSLFLKKLYGSGYTLHLTLNTNNSKLQNADTSKNNHRRRASSFSEDESKFKPISNFDQKGKSGSILDSKIVAEILSTVQKHVSSASLKSAFEQNSTEVQVQIPTTDGTSITALFPALFTDLYDKADDLLIQHIGLTFTTMDDVFAKVGEKEEETLTSNSNGHFTADTVEEMKVDKKFVGFALWRRQFYGFLIKRCQYGFRKYQLWLIQALIAIALMVGAMMVFNQRFKERFDPDDLVYLFPALVFVGLTFHSSSFILLPLEEKLSKAKQLQLMTGASPLSYWLSCFIWDFGNVLVVSCIITIFIPILQKDDVLLESGIPAIFMLILVVYGFVAIAYNYAFSLVAPRVAGGFAAILSFHLFSSFLGFIMTVWETSSDMRPPKFLSHLFCLLLPPYAGIRSLIKLVFYIVDTDRCDRYLRNMCIGCHEYDYCDDCNQQWDRTCHPNLTSDYDYDNGIPGFRKEEMTCCENCDEFSEYGVECFEAKSVVTFSDSYVIYDEFNSKKLAFTQGILQFFLYQIIMGCFYFTLVLLHERGTLKRLKSKIFKPKPILLQTQNENEMDEDVRTEINRIKNLVHENRMYEDAIVSNGLSKTFGTFAAVSNVNFGVKPGVCFGLLGANGAGKTTLFRMLTGDTDVTDGNAFSSDKQCSLQRDKQKFLSTIGYCPQFDAIVKELTGTQMLELYCRLRGLALTSEGVRAEAHRWLVKMGLEGSANVRCRKYSGGMKRRLSTAMALIGQAPVLMLDEPSSGVDPLGRRQLWKILSSSTRNSGQAIILTSHRNETEFMQLINSECEALCSRISIMINGGIRCMGSVEHLKNKFAQGFCLTVKLKLKEKLYEKSIRMENHDMKEIGEDVDKQNHETLQNIIFNRFNPSILLDQNQNIMQFQLQNTNLRWNDVFKIMEDIKSIMVTTEEINIFIDDYVVNETSLEQIFLHFARAQYPEQRKVKGSLCTRILSCQCIPR